MNTETTNVLKNTQDWLDAKGYKHNWLAKQLNIGEVYMSQIFSGKRALLPKYIFAISEVTGIPLSEIAKNKDESKQPLYVLRGKISNDAGRSALSQALLDANRYVGLVNRRKERSK